MVAVAPDTSRGYIAQILVSGGPGNLPNLAGGPNFSIKEAQARIYMKMAEIDGTPSFSSLSDFVREPLIKMEAVTANERHK
jgi:hypothetical protein